MGTRFTRCVSSSASMCVLLAGASGCSAPDSMFRIVDYRAGNSQTSYVETFDEAYYALDGRGGLDVVLRRRSPSAVDTGQEIIQVICIRSVWRCLPGKTVANDTQINGTVSYYIMSGGAGALFEGAGSVLCSEHRNGQTLTGKLEHAVLKPTRRMDAGVAIFEKAELDGGFHAKRDPRAVVRIRNQMQRLFNSFPMREDRPPA